MERIKLLIADDDRSLLQALGIRLAAAGYEVIAAVDGYQAVHFAQEHHPDIVVLDIHMPAGDGFSVQERMRKHCELHGTPVVYLTGDRTAEVRSMAEERGAALVYKPFDTGELLATIKETLAAC
ncbi:MAG: response regulator [Phycisphaerales bacterium]|nr:response regulator [Phycisphaerae bacterium]NNF43426.1 response regulator [Phycisphaerales bacterium]NNM24952.1 response regulator [Phycisphaerales bacterium]